MHDKFYSTNNWKRIRDAQLARAPVCQGCENAAATRPALDHIIPIKQGGAKRERAQLQSLCRPCHNAKTGAEKAGKQWIPPKHKGCDEHGVPNDPSMSGGWGTNTTA